MPITQEFFLNFWRCPQLTKIMKIYKGCWIGMCVVVKKNVITNEIARIGGLNFKKNVILGELIVWVW